MCFYIYFCKNKQCTVLLSLPQLHLVACVELRGSWCLWRPWMTIFDHQASFPRDSMIFWSLGNPWVCLAAISYLQWSTSGPQTEAQGVWTDPSHSSLRTWINERAKGKWNKQNVEMAVRSTRRPMLFPAAFRKLNWQMPSQRVPLVRLHQSWSQQQHQHPRRSLFLWLCIKTWNIKLVLPWKLTYPLNIDAWKMTFFFLNWSLFRGYAGYASFFWGGVISKKTWGQCICRILKGVNE